MAHATVSRCLARRGMSRVPRPAREQVRRFEWPCPGDLLQMDTKRLARFTRPGHKRDRRSLHAPAPRNASASAGSSATRSSTTTPGWSTPRSTPTSRRRHRHRLRRARAGVLRRPRHHRPPPADRQRLDLHPQPRPARAAGRARHPAPPDPAPHPQAQRQGRALPADPGPRMGLRTALPLKHRPSRSAPDLADPLQHHQAPQLDRQPAAHQPHPRSEGPEAQHLRRAGRSGGAASARCRPGRRTAPCGRRRCPSARGERDARATRAPRAPRRRPRRGGRAAPCWAGTGSRAASDGIMASVTVPFSNSAPTASLPGCCHTLDALQAEHVGVERPTRGRGPASAARRSRCR